MSRFLDRHRDFELPSLQQTCSPSDKFSRLHLTEPRLLSRRWQFERAGPAGGIDYGHALSTFELRIKLFALTRFLDRNLRLANARFFVWKCPSD